MTDSLVKGNTWGLCRWPLDYQPTRSVPRDNWEAKMVSRHFYLLASSLLSLLFITAPSIFKIRKSFRSLSRKIATKLFSFLRLLLRRKNKRNMILTIALKWAKNFFCPKSRAGNLNFQKMHSNNFVQCQWPPTAATSDTCFVVSRSTPSQW